MPELPYQVIPLSMVLFGAILGYYSWRYDRRAVLADAVVIELREAVDADGEVGHQTVFRFDANGRSWDVVDRVIRDPVRHAIGQRVTVSFPRGDPSGATLHHGRMTLVGSVIAVVGLAWLFLDILMRSARR